MEQNQPSLEVTEEGQVLDTSKDKKIIEKENSFAVKLDEEEVRRVMTLVKQSFKNTPPRLNAENGDYDVFNYLLSVTNFENCFDGIDIARTLYEAMLPMFRSLYDSKQNAVAESNNWIIPMTNLFTELREKGYHKGAETPFGTIHRFIEDIKKGEVTWTK